MAVAKKNFSTVEDIKLAALNAGDKWFKPENMRFHRGRLLSGVIGGHYFIVSSKANWEDYTRVFQVCQINEDRTIDYASEKKHTYKYQAIAEARELLAAEEGDSLQEPSQHLIIRRTTTGKIVWTEGPYAREHNTDTTPRRATR